MLSLLSSSVLPLFEESSLVISLLGVIILLLVDSRIGIPISPFGSLSFVGSSFVFSSVTFLCIGLSIKPLFDDSFSSIVSTILESFVSAV